MSRTIGSLICQSAPIYTSPPGSRCFKSRSEFVIYPHKACSLSWRTLPHLCFSCGVHYSSTSICKRIGRSIRSSTDSDRLNPSSENDMNSRTRIFKIIQTLQFKLTMRIGKIKSRFFVKALFFLVGFYCATAFATVIGQTGEWDIFAAGLAVVVVEGVGALMYKGSFPLLNSIRGLIAMFNYWKVGLSLGLFLDAFKFEMDDIFESPNLFSFELDSVFPLFL